MKLGAVHLCKCLAEHQRILGLLARIEADNHLAHMANQTTTVATGISVLTSGLLSALTT